MIKVSAVKPQHHRVRAPARLFNAQEDFMATFHASQLDSDCVAVLRFQAPMAACRAHPARGKVLAAIHVTPEVLAGGPLGRVREGDMILLDGDNGILEAQVEAEEWARRTSPSADLSANGVGMGRELFAMFHNAIRARPKRAPRLSICRRR